VSSGLFVGFTMPETVALRHGGGTKLDHWRFAPVDDNILIPALVLAGVLVSFFILRSLAWWLWRAGRRVTVSLAKPAGAYLFAHPIRIALATRFPFVYRQVAARLHLEAFTGLTLSLIVGGMLYAVALFSGLVNELLEAEGLIRLDDAVSHALDVVRVPAATHVFRAITDLGSGPTIVAVALTATGFLWIENRRRYIPALWVTLAGAQLTTWAGKFLIGRARPAFLDLAHAAFPSFPSGHTTGAMAIYGFLAYIVIRRISWDRARFEVLYWAAVLIALVGFSRVYLGVHFLSDVLSGMIVGVFWLLAGVAVAEWPRRKDTQTSRGASA